MAVDNAVALSNNAAPGTACVTQALKDLISKHFVFNCVGQKTLPPSAEVTAWELSEDSFVGGSFVDSAVSNLTEGTRRMLHDALSAIHRELSLEHAVSPR